MPSLQEHTDLLQRLSNNLAWGMALETGASRPPVQALDLVGQHYLPIARGFLSAPMAQDSAALDRVGGEGGRPERFPILRLPSEKFAVEPVSQSPLTGFTLGGQTDSSVLWSDKVGNTAENNVMPARADIQKSTTRGVSGF